MRNYKIIFALLFLNTVFSYAEEDSIDPIIDDVIIPFEEKIAVSLSGKYNIGIFNYEDLSYRTDKPWDVGLGLRYKNLAATAYIAITPNKYAFDAGLNFYLKEMYYETFIKRYTNFYINGDEKDAGHENAGLDMMSAGISVGWIRDYQNHSLRSVFSLSEKQTVSNGSLLYGFGVFYSSLFSDNDNIPRYKERQHIIHFGPSFGYSYTWIFKHALYLNLMFNIGTDLGINVNGDKILFVPQLTPKITFGHHNTSWSVNMVMGCNATVLVWDKDVFSGRETRKGSYDTLVPATMSVTFSKRF